MKSYSDVVYMIQNKDTITTVRFEDGSVGMSCPGYTSEHGRGFRIDFLPKHIPMLEHLIEMLKGAAFLLVLAIGCQAVPAQASPASNWCPTLVAQATELLEHQTDSDLTGKITVPGSIAKEDQRAYRKLIRRGRFLLRRYHDQLSVQTILNVLKSDCEDVYNPTRNGTY